MQTKSNNPYLPLALIVLAVSIVTAAFVIAGAIQAASTQQAIAQHQAAVTTSAAMSSAANTAAVQASMDATLARGAAVQQNLLYANQGPSALDQLTAANQAAMAGH